MPIFGGGEHQLSRLEQQIERFSLGGQLMGNGSWQDIRGTVEAAKALPSNRMKVNKVCYDPPRKPQHRRSVCSNHDMGDELQSQWHIGLITLTTMWTFDLGLWYGGTAYVASISLKSFRPDERLAVHIYNISNQRDSVMRCSS